MALAGDGAFGGGVSVVGDAVVALLLAVAAACTPARGPDLAASDLLALAAIWQPELPSLVYGWHGGVVAAGSAVRWCSVEVVARRVQLGCGPYLGPGGPRLGGVGVGRRHPAMAWRQWRPSSFSTAWQLSVATG